jgi:hypothetical protein
LTGPAQPNREELLAEYAKHPVRPYLQVDCFSQPPNYLRDMGITDPRELGITNESGHSAMHSNVHEMRESDAPVIVQVLAGTNKEEALALITRAYQGINEAWLEVVSPPQPPHNPDGP